MGIEPEGERESWWEWKRDREGKSKSNQNAFYTCMRFQKNRFIVIYYLTIYL